MLNAGVGRVDITPPTGVAHAGWGAQTHQVSVGNDMALLVTAVVVENNDIELAIVDVDIGIFTGQQDEDIRQLISEKSGIPFENIRLAYSHTHSAPITFGEWIKDLLLETDVADGPELPLSDEESLQAYLDRATAEKLRSVLASVGGVRVDAARCLRIDRTTLYRLIRKFGIEAASEKRD